MAIQSVNDLPALKKKIEKEKSELSKKTQVIVYQGTCGFASGAHEILEALKKELDTRSLKDVAVLEHSCMGCCYLEPYMSVTNPEGIYTLYGYLTAEKVTQIVETHLVGGEIVQEHMVDINTSFFNHQEKRITELLGKIDPFKIEDYIFYDGYQGLSKTLEMKQTDVIEEIKRSGLRGRGGAGFPTGVKWNFAYSTESNQKYMVCNADEGDPGAYMNRAELEGNPACGIRRDGNRRIRHWREQRLHLRESGVSPGRRNTQCVHCPGQRVRSPGKRNSGNLFRF